MTQEALNGFEAVCNRHFDELYGYVGYRLAPDFNAAADITQDVFLAACKAWTSYKDNGFALSWLRSIARRKVADHFRAQAKGARPGGAPAAEQGVHEPHTTDAEGNALIIASVMKALPEDHVCLLEEKYLDLLSVREMAQRRQMTEQAVASALHRARQSFKAYFERILHNREIEQ